MWNLGNARYVIVDSHASGQVLSEKRRVPNEKKRARAPRRVALSDLGTLGAAGVDCAAGTW